MTKIKLFAGSSNPTLAKKIAKELKINIGKIELSEFPNKEIKLRIIDDVEKKVVFVLQSTCNLTERYILELGLICDALRRKGAKKIIAIVPWLGYSPQDKVFRDGEPLSSQVVVKVLESFEIDEFVVLDLHSNEILNFFHKRVWHLSASSVFIDYFRNKVNKKWCSVALDNGALERARLFAKSLNLQIARLEKYRNRNTGEIKFLKLEGSVYGENVISFDDFVSTGSTIIKASEFLNKIGVKKFFYCSTHLIVPEAMPKISKSLIEKLFVTDSVYYKKQLYPAKIKILSLSKLFANFIIKHSL